MKNTNKNNEQHVQNYHKPLLLEGLDGITEK